MSTIAPRIRLDHVTVSLARKTALSNLSWQLMPGEHWAVLGRNGAGKSTFLRLLRGEVRPDQNSGGSCEWNFTGRPDSSPLVVRPLARLVSAEMHRNYVRRGWRITGLELVCSGFVDSLLPSFPTAGQEAAASALATALGVGHCAHQYIGTLSQGQLRMMLLARALVTAPTLLLLDEPFDGLDSQARHRFNEALEQAGLASSIICSAHRKADLPALISHCLLLEKGSGVYSGPMAGTPATLHDEMVYPAAAPVDQLTATNAGQEAPEAIPFENALTHTPGTPSFAREHFTGNADQPRPILSLANAAVYVNRTLVLDDISWQVNTGENWRISGPNGSGKSTLLRVLAGLEQVALGGSLYWFGCQYPPLDELQRHVAYLSDLLHAGYSYDLTAEELVHSGFDGSIGLWRDILPAEKEQASWWIRFLGLESHATRALSSLSSGTARRFFMARALVNRPRVLLLDEPCSGLDSPSRALFHRSLNQVLGTGVQCIYVSHHDDDIPVGISHELRLEGGRADYCGPLRAKSPGRA